MSQVVLMLEDNADRLTRFSRVLREAWPQLTLHHWRDAAEMIRECPPYLSDCVLICLDHDLDPIPTPDCFSRDAGDGLQVAKFLAAAKPTCPILIHSSNGDGARRMLGEFELACCQACTILPLGEDWIEIYWRRNVTSLLTGT